MMAPISKSISLLRIQKEQGYCSIDAYPELNVVEFFGNGEITSIDMLEIEIALASSLVSMHLLDRFVFIFPSAQSDVAFRLAQLLRPRIYKCAFIVHPSQHTHFVSQLFWHLCDHKQLVVAYRDALRLIGKYEVKPIYKKDDREDDLLYDYRSITIDVTQLDVPFDEGL